MSIITASDLSLHVPTDGYVIKGIRPEGIQVNEQAYATSLALNPDNLQSGFPATQLSEVDFSALQIVMDWQPEVILLGTWEANPMPQVNLIGRCQQAGVGLEIMTLGAACRTYNVLTAEERSVAVILLQNADTQHSPASE